MAGVPLEGYLCNGLHDPPESPFENVTFTQSDIRSLPYDDFFDAILAVSVIEHVGLENPQVNLDDLPPADRRGDVDAVQELTRVLKPEGKLIMTLPFGLINGRILDGSARGYTRNSLCRFEEVASVEFLEYYEYQHAEQKKYFEKYPNCPSVLGRVVLSLRLLSLRQRLGLVSDTSSSSEEDTDVLLPSRPGLVTWRCIPPKNTQATHDRHTDGVVAGVWSPLP